MAAALAVALAAALTAAVAVARFCSETFGSSVTWSNGRRERLSWCPSSTASPAELRMDPWISVLASELRHGEPESGREEMTQRSMH